jgi:hypothetical protein
VGVEHRRRTGRVSAEAVSGLDQPAAGRVSGLSGENLGNWTPTPNPSPQGGVISDTPRFMCVIWLQLPNLELQHVEAASL